MPKEGYTSITVSDKMYERIQKVVAYLNEQAGFKKFRSVSHFVEVAIMEYAKDTAELKKILAEA